MKANEKRKKSASFDWMIHSNQTGELGWIISIDYYPYYYTYNGIGFTLSIFIQSNRNTHAKYQFLRAVFVSTALVELVPSRVNTCDDSTTACVFLGQCALRVSRGLSFPTSLPSLVPSHTHHHLPAEIRQQKGVHGTEHFTQVTRFNKTV